MDALNNATGYEIDVTWHETAGGYARKFGADARSLVDVRDALHIHDSYGRTYHVYAFTPAGRVTVKGPALAALRAG